MKTAQRAISLGILSALLGIGWVLRTAQPSAAASPVATSDAASIPWADEGRQWVFMQQFEVKQPAYAAGFVDDVFSVTAGYGGEIHYTTDGGKTWISTPVDLGADRNIDIFSRPAIRFADAAHGMIVLKIKDGDLIALKTADGVKTWTETALLVKPESGTNYQGFLSHDGAILTLMDSSVPIKIYVLDYKQSDDA